VVTAKDATAALEGGRIKARADSDGFIVRAACRQRAR